MNPEMIELTNEQREVILQLGNPDSVLEAIPLEVMKELLDRGLVCKRSDGRIDFTELGEQVHESIAGEP